MRVIQPEAITKQATCEDTILQALEKHIMLRKSSLRAFCIKFDILEFSSTMNKLEQENKIHYETTDHWKFSGYVKN